MNRSEAIMNAWEKISKYVKENFSGVFETDLRFRWKHDVYGWTEFGVTPNGDAFICHGSHGCGDSMTDWYYHPTIKKTYEPVRLNRTEEVINDWKRIKDILIAKAEKEKSLYSFEV